MRGLEQLTLQMYQLPPEINKEIISAQDADFACFSNMKYTRERNLSDIYPEGVTRK